MIDPDELALGFFLVLIGGIYYAVANYWFVIIAVLVVFLACYLLALSINSAIEARERNPPKPPQTVIVAHGDLDTGSYVLARSRIKDGEYPALLTLSYFNKDGVVTGVRMKEIKYSSDEVSIVVGQHKKMSVTCRTWLGPKRPENQKAISETTTSWIEVPQLSQANA